MSDNIYNPVGFRNAIKVLQVWEILDMTLKQNLFVVWLLLFYNFLVQNGVVILEFRKVMSLGQPSHGLEAEQLNHTYLGTID